MLGLRSLRWAAILLILILLLGYVPSLSPSRSAATTNQDLAATYAPELHFSAGEAFYPTSVDYIIGSSTVDQRNPTGSPTVVDPAPTPSTLGSNTSTDLYLNNKLGSLKAIAADYTANGRPLGYYAYVHLVDQGSVKIIQYWLFYAYNNGPLNDHQGDIEVVQVFLDSSGNPTSALFSQHFSGENAVWSDVEKTQGTHPVVYVAQGSHANYFRSYQGRIGIENDVVSNDGLVISPSQLNLVVLANQSWLNFAGRWGYWGTDLQVAQGQAGPYGPVFNQDGIRWAHPFEYESQTLAVGSNYFIVAWLAANFLLIFIAYIAIRAAWKTYRIYGHSRKGELRTRSLLKGRLGIAVVLVVVGVVITVAALFLPWYQVSSSSQSGPLGALGNVNLVNLDGINGLRINFFAGASSDASSGYSTLVSTQIPFAIILGAGIVLLFLDLVGFSGKPLKWKFAAGAVSTLLPFLLIIIFMMMLPSLLPWASLLLPGRNVPSGVNTMVQAVASNPISGTAIQTFPVVGSTTVTWGFGIGAYLFLAAALLRLVGAVVAGGAKRKPNTPATPVVVPSQGVSLGPRARTPSPPKEQRRLTAIMFTDIVGFTTLAQNNEKLALRLLEKQRGMIRSILPRHSGIEVKTIGDAFLLEFGSALEATECAVEMQKTLHEFNEFAKDKVLVRVGIHVGDVIHKEGDVLGDAVNIASRIEPLASAGGICISEQVFDQVRNKIQYPLTKLQPKELKNVQFQVDVYKLELPWETASDSVAPPK